MNNATAGLVLADNYYSKTDLEALSDGEVLDLVYWAVDNYAGPDYAKLDLIREILTLSKEN